MLLKTVDVGALPVFTYSDFGRRDIFPGCSFWWHFMYIRLLLGSFSNGLHVQRLVKSASAFLHARVLSTHGFLPRYVGILSGSFSPVFRFDIIAPGSAQR